MSSELNKYGKSKLPPGQQLVNTLPILDLGIQPRISLDEWRLEISGLVAKPTILNWASILELPQKEEKSDFHCVTGWSIFDLLFTGVSFSTIMELVEVLPCVTHVLFQSYDSYTTNITIEDAKKEDVLLAYKLNGEMLSLEHGGPLRTIIPQLYAWKGSKWIKSIQFLDCEIRGFWETRGYSNTALPWLNDRYSID